MIDAIQNFKPFFHAFIESLPYGIMLLDNDGKVIDLNRNISFMLGITSPSAVGAHFSEILNPSVKPAVEQLIGEIMDQGFAMEKEIAANIHSGVTITAALNGSVLLDETAPQGVIVVCRELSARQEIDRMKELEKLKSNFISGITHDFKAPLTSIVGYADLILEMCSEKLSAEETEFVGIIKQEGMRLTRMVNDILNVAKIESGKLQIKSELVDIREIIDEVIKVSAVQSNKFHFVMNVADTLPKLWMDKELFIRVFMNLASNAIKYSPDGGEITFSGYPKDQNYVFDVADHGMGMSEESLSHLFEKFFRVKSDSMKGISGTGLGLVITRGIIEAHGGTMGVASTLGKGTTFSVLLPMRLANHKPDGA